MARHLDSWWNCIYCNDDVVEYTDGTVTSSYIAVASSSNQAPSSGGTVTRYIETNAKGQSASPTTTQGDLMSEVQVLMKDLLLEVKG